MKDLNYNINKVENGFVVGVSWQNSEGDYQNETHVFSTADAVLDFLNTELK